MAGVGHDPIPTVGVEKVSVTITRKTRGDLLISQHSSERWFRSEGAAMAAMQHIFEVFIEEPEPSLNHKDEPQGEGG